MKNVWIAAAVALAVSGFVQVVSSPPSPRGEYTYDQDEWLLQLEARIVELEGREGPVLLAAAGAPPSAQYDVRLATLMKQVEALEKGRTARQAPEPGETSESEEIPSVSGAERERLHRREVEAARAAIRRLPKEKRAQAFYNLAMTQRDRRLHELEEAILRELIEDAGPDDELAKESAYQIGYARSRRGDNEGARQAWIEASAHFEATAWRRSYARFNAASAAIKMKQPDLALRELEDLISELESEASEHPQKKTILGRSRLLLASLEG